MNEHGQTVCLNMIVRNEAHVIERCLTSVRPLIDSWAIVDTGSTDGTQDRIRELLADLPGELIERPWVNFAHNRTEALEHAGGRADYVFVIDADEVVELEPGFALPRLSAGVYIVEVAFNGFVYPRRQLVRSDLPWRYTGVLHEHIQCDEPHTEAELPGIHTVPTHDGARARDPTTYRRDALRLEEALIDEPDNARYVFYLAQSYRDAGDLEAAIRTYRRRFEMGGWEEERWYSLYQIPQLEERLGRPWAETLQGYLAAWQFHPDRACPLFRVAMHHQREREYHLAHLFLARAITIPRPRGDRLFVESAVYDYLLPVEYAVAAYYVGDHEAAVATNNALLRDSGIPPDGVAQVVRNRRFSLDARHPAGGGAAVGRLRVVACVRDPGPELDETVDLLLRQDDPDFEVVLVDDGSREPVAPRLRADSRLEIVRRDTAAGEAAAIAELVARCDRHDVVIPLPQGHRPATPGALSAIRKSFRDPQCSLLYAPHRGADGRLGAAEPAASAAEHDARGPELAAESAPCFRAELVTETPAATWSDHATLWRAAGFEGTRFLDDALTADASPQPPRAPRAHIAPAAANDDRAPSISCLMVTRDRLALATRAIRSFGDQTHAERELVIVSEGDSVYRAALERFADEEQIPGVRVVAAEPGLSLGALRNVSLDAATGDIVCQWDDDDCSHPDRLAEQLAAMEREGADACFLTEHLQYLEDAALVFWIDWTLAGSVTNEWQLFPGTVMMRRDERFRYPERGPLAQRGEDSVLVDQLNRNVPIARMGGSGHLYLYRFHGRNTFPREHHHHITTCAGANAEVQSRAAAIRDAVDYFPVPKPMPVMGAAGPVFVVG